MAGWMYEHFYGLAFCFSCFWRALRFVLVSRSFRLGFASLCAAAFIARIKHPSSCGFFLLVIIWTAP
jgi:hypothetical protein